MVKAYGGDEEGLKPPAITRQTFSVVDTVVVSAVALNTRPSRMVVAGSGTLQEDSWSITRP